VPAFFYSGRVGWLVGPPRISQLPADRRCDSDAPPPCRSARRRTRAPVGPETPRDDSRGSLRQRHQLGALDFRDYQGGPGTTDLCHVPNKITRRIVFLENPFSRGLATQKKIATRKKTTSARCGQCWNGPTYLGCAHAARHRRAPRAIVHGHGRGGRQRRGADYAGEQRGSSACDVHLTGNVVAPLRKGGGHGQDLPLAS